LYDCEKDPLELNNVFNDPAYAALKDTMMQQLFDWLVLTSDVTPMLEDSRDMPAFPYEVDLNCMVQPLPDSGNERKRQREKDIFFKINGVMNW